MPRPRTTRDVFVVQGNYGFGHGWEDLTQEDSRPDARAQYRTYRENEPQYRHRVITRRERILPARFTQP